MGHVSQFDFLYERQFLIDKPEFFVLYKKRLISVTFNISIICKTHCVIHVPCLTGSAFGFSFAHSCTHASFLTSFFTILLFFLPFKYFLRSIIILFCIDPDYPSKGDQKNTSNSSCKPTEKSSQPL